MQLPLYQRAIRLSVVALLAVIAVGAVLDATSNATTIITPRATYYGSAALIIALVTVAIYAKLRPIRWITRNGIETRITRIGPVFVAATVGCIALLWVPRLVHPDAPSRKPVSEVPQSPPTQAISSPVVPPNLPGFDSTKGHSPAPLDIRVGDFVDGVPLDVREGYGTTPGPVTFAFPVTFINQGRKPLVISGYELIPLGCDYEYPIRDQDGDQGFFPDPRSQDPIFLPISVPPGEAKTLFLKTGIVVSHEAFFATLDLGAGATLRDLMLRVLPHDVADEAGVGQDLFGNLITYGIGNRGLFDYELKEPATAVQPTYKLVVYVLSGGPRYVVFAPYPKARRAISNSDCPEEAFQKRPTLQLP